MSYLVPLIAVVFVVVVGCYLASIPHEEDHQYIVAILGLIVPFIIVAIGVELGYIVIASLAVLLTGLGGLEFSEFVHDPQHACSRSFSLAVTSSGLSYDVSDVGLPSKKVMASGKNGDDGDLLLFRDGSYAGDISAGTLRLFISWECSRPVAGVKVSPSSGNWVAEEVGELILLGMECPVAVSCSGDSSGMLLESD
ncbi:hypothetical protein Tco_1305650 [Tanacetum coccineum]